MDYKIIEKNNMRYIVVPELKEKGLNLSFTTKDMDIGLETNTNIGEVKKHFDSIFEFMGENPIEVYSGYQVHSANIESIKDINEGSEYDIGKVFYDTDGLITDIKDIALVSRFADCTPIILFDPIKKVQVNIHSGWKGTLGRIGANGVNKMVNEYGSNPKDIIVVIGPTIGKNDFEVESDVMTQFKNEFEFHQEIINKKNDIKYLIDLHKTNIKILLAEGIKKENITLINLSTFANEDLLHSYRRDGSNFGLMGAISILI